jgi:hypothetical protein
LKLATKILEMKKEYKGIEYEIKKDNDTFSAEIEREEIDGTKSKNAKTTDNRAKKYIDQVI